MRRSFQEILELIAFGLIALVIGWLLIWGIGWVFTGLGLLLRIIAGFIWVILKYIIPVAIVALVVYLLVRLVMNQRDKPSATAATGGTSANPPSVTNQAPASGTQPVTPASGPEAGTEVTTPPVTQDAADDKRSVETRADNAEPVDTDVDTSGFKKMDDLAEELEDDSDEDDKKDA